MGFDLYANTGVLTFAGTRFKGAEVTVRLDMPLADFIAFEEHTTVEERLRWFVEHALIKWNVEANGKPVEPTLDAFLALPRQFTTRVLVEWMKTVNDPDIPFEQPSHDGDTSAGE